MTSQPPSYSFFLSSYVLVSVLLSYLEYMRIMGGYLPTRASGSRPFFTAFCLSFSSCSSLSWCLSFSHTWSTCGSWEGTCLQGPRDQDPSSQPSVSPSAPAAPCPGVCPSLILGVHADHGRVLA